MKRIIKYFICLCLWLYISPATKADAESQYVVNSGDTLWKIALYNGVELITIIQSNPQVSNPHLIFPGQKITIPARKKVEKGIILSASEKSLLELTNMKRANAGLKPLIVDYSLTKAARKKALDMMENEYVSHISPRYGDSTTMLKSFQIPFEKARESIGAGFSSPEKIFTLWMNSAVNQSNLLDKLSTHIGVGHAEGGLHGHYWTVLIIQRDEGGS
ncbi:SafA/ExsA family spore coat assembly protein [Bacillus sp. DTU_2020_1000418_1_SI_GHA_SEK_038]|uniref:SafA/ExsA family spore coat assembly protein n=1 Tax=Bacillus sp. DTU_2020_1000418_1_SI_GHA_SEK_038 TaxID=3077585 RepID=UPI0028EE8122|nr:SafA/ExsA family spore coat assembly protein [Bacillus sp. DTU_2020_1000418_1_SI_GHA_SEK_038]WNS77047.1 SafA/ExsA family spore coat assembly protein [Bacillus sp. DTU_2020_1000418_1_SI_GHA_SEK_038]